MSEGTGKYLVPGSRQTDNESEQVFRKITNWAAHTISGGVGGTAATAITDWPHTLATHTDTGEGTAYSFPSGRASFQISSDASHSGTTTVEILVSNDNVLFEVLGSRDVTGASATKHLACDRPYGYVKSNCAAHGDSTNAVTVTMVI